MWVWLDPAYERVTVRTVQLASVGCDFPGTAPKVMVTMAPAPSSNLKPAQPFFLVRLLQRILSPIRSSLQHVEIHDSHQAHLICDWIPAQCPFERDITVFGHHLLHIPPMCRINPVYEELMELRFRALSYLADVCGEDITPYIT